DRHPAGDAVMHRLDFEVRVILMERLFGAVEGGLQEGLIAVEVDRFGVATELRDDVENLRAGGDGAEEFVVGRQAAEFAQDGNGGHGGAATAGASLLEVDIELLAGRRDPAFLNLVDNAAHLRQLFGRDQVFNDEVSIVLVELNLRGRKTHLQSPLKFRL